MLQSIANKSRRIQREIREDPHVPVQNYPISSERMYMEKVLNGGKRKFIRKGDMKVEVRKFMFW
jgi:hypothetical protein